MNWFKDKNVLIVRDGKNWVLGEVVGEETYNYDESPGETYFKLKVFKHQNFMSPIIIPDDNIAFIEIRYIKQVCKVKILNKNSKEWVKLLYD